MSLSDGSVGEEGNSKDAPTNAQLITVLAGRDVASPHFGHAELKDLHQKGTRTHFDGTTTQNRSCVIQGGE